MTLSEKYIEYCLEYVLEHNMKDIEFLDKFVSKGKLKELVRYRDKPFKRLSYTEAVDILIQNKEDVKWGDDLSTKKSY